MAFPREAEKPFFKIYSLQKFLTVKLWFCFWVCVYTQVHTHMFMWMHAFLGIHLSTYFFSSLAIFDIIDHPMVFIFPSSLLLILFWYLSSLLFIFFLDTTSFTHLLNLEIPESMTLAYIYYTLSEKTSILCWVINCDSLNSVSPKAISQP